MSSALTQRIIPITILDGNNTPTCINQINIKENENNTKSDEQNAIKSIKEVPESKVTSGEKDENIKSDQKVERTVDKASSNLEDSGKLNKSSNEKGGSVLNRLKFLSGKADNKKATAAATVAVADLKTESKKDAAFGENIQQQSATSAETQVENDEIGDIDSGQAISAPTLINSLKDDLQRTRYVPINLHDGRVLQRDPDETMEITTEFTNYCHQEFDDSISGTPSPFSSPKSRKEQQRSSSKNESDSEKERIVPIVMENGDTFMPTFTSLDDVEPPPEWSAFNAANRPKKGDRLVEKNIPIVTEQTDRDESIVRKFSRATSSSSREESPVRSTTKRTTSRQCREKMTKSHEKRVQHSVRFVDEEDSGPDSKKRSSSLDGRKRQPPQSSASPKKSNLRERHRSGGHSVRNDSSQQEKTLHEIDRDINKIWRELQELDAFPNMSSKPSISSSISSRLSPARGDTVRQTSAAKITPAATPVKIRTFTTPTPTNVHISAASSSDPPSRNPSPPVTWKSVEPSSITSSSPSSQRHSLTRDTPPKIRYPLPTRDTGTYNPRRDLEPTKPGAITPKYGPSAALTPRPIQITRASSPIPYRVVRINNNNDPVEPNTPKFQSSMATKEMDLEVESIDNKSDKKTAKNTEVGPEEKAVEVTSLVDKACQTEAEKRTRDKKCLLQ